MAIQHTLFVSANRLIKDTALGQSVDHNLIHPYILLAQDKYIFPALGTDLYDKLKSDIQGETLAGAYLTLMQDYIQKSLVWFAFAELIPNIRIRYVNNSIITMDNEQGTGASYEDIKPIINNALDSAEFFKKRMITYLNDNSSSFSEYTSNTGSDLSPSQSAFYSGINMDSNYSDNKTIQAILSAAGVKGVC